MVNEKSHEDNEYIARVQGFVIKNAEKLIPIASDVLNYAPIVQVAERHAEAIIR